MIQITLRDYFKKYGPDKWNSLENTLGYTENQNKKRYTKFADYHGNEIEISIPTFEETMQLLDKVNKEIKNPEVPKNIKNKFYRFKHKLLKDLVKYLNKITVIGDCGNYYALHYKDYVFHQLKHTFRNPLKCTHKEEYIPQTYNIPFNEEDYKMCLVGAMTYSYNKILKYA